jgi:hypothetical protein
MADNAQLSVFREFYRIIFHLSWMVISELHFQVTLMPRPCAVEAHARSYKETSECCCGCHGLAPWRLTLAATKKLQNVVADATALCRGGSRFMLKLERQLPGA